MDTKDKKHLITASLVLVVLLSLFVFVKFIGEVKGLSYIGKGEQTNTISFSGEGEVTAVPDIAVITFTSRAQAGTAKAAEDTVAKKTDAALSFLKEKGIEEKDIKTLGYNSYPRYSNNEVSCLAIGCPRPGTTIIGYEVSQTISVKLRNADDAGMIIEGITAAGINEIAGPDFQVENEEELREEARALAIEDAKNKARSLEKDLGVRLVRIVSFSESGSYPYAFGRGEDAVAQSTKEAPSLPKGENTVTSNVTITYEIR